MKIKWAALGLIALLAAPAGAATRLKELVSLEGVRDNQLIGYGLVVGLNGTGDRKQTVFSAQSLTNLLQQMGVSVPPTAITVRNTAAVMVTATLPGFAQEGVHIDATAAAIGDAANLQGGLLILTSLRGVDGQVYAVAQGPVVTGGFVAGKSGNSQTVNHPTVGRVPSGAIVERASPSLPPTGRLKLQLRQPDFTTAVRVSDIVNKKFPRRHAVSQARKLRADIDHRAAGIHVARDRVCGGHRSAGSGRGPPARVIVNERTGTIVMGKEVRVSPVAIMHGNLTVEIQTILQVSQPAPFGQGTTEVVPQPTTTSGEEKARNLVLKEGATVEQLVQALSSIGSTPRDIIAILQSLRAAGALEADLEVI